MSRANLPLKETATHLVFGQGSFDAEAMFIGEAPGKNEDLQGLPFVGAAGRLLNDLLKSIKLPREDVFITSILKYRPPGNRNPSLEEIRAHTPYLVQQILIIEPKIIVPLGNFATRFMLSGLDIEEMMTISGITHLHGVAKRVVFDHHEFTVLPMFHPAAALYTGGRLKQDMLKDFLKLKKVLKQM